MSGYHDYRTEVVPVTSLTGEDVLLGECGGLSAVFSVNESSVMKGCLAVETEHGYLYVAADDDVLVLRRAGQ